MSEKARYLVYYRVSTKGQGESGLGLEAQRAYVHHFLPPGCIVDEVTEVESAKTIEDRPVLQAAIARCRAEGIGLAFAKVDRLSRLTEDALKILKQLDGYLFSCDIPTKPGERMDKFMLTIFMAIADRERELISLRTSQALQSKKQRDGSVHPVKGHKSNFTAEGRQKAAAKKRASAKREDRKTRLAVREMRKNGDSLEEIARKLNEDGHVTATGKRFHRMTVKRILERNGQ